MRANAPDPADVVAARELRSAAKNFTGVSLSEGVSYTEVDTSERRLQRAAVAYAEAIEAIARARSTRRKPAKVSP